MNIKEQRLYEIQQAVKKVMAKAQKNNNHIAPLDPLVKAAEELAIGYGFRITISPAGWPQLYEYARNMTLEMFEAKEQEHPVMHWAYQYGESLGPKFIAEVKRLVASGGVDQGTFSTLAVMATALYNLADEVAGSSRGVKKEIANLRKF